MSFSPMHSDHGSECKARGAVCEGIFWKSSFFLGKRAFSATFPGKRDMRAELAAWQQAKAGNRPLEPKTVEKVRGFLWGWSFLRLVEREWEKE